MTYPGLIVKANWFTAQVKVKEIKFSTSSVSQIEVGAFNSTAFKSVTKLTFPNMNLSPINKGIFNGLESLQFLAMEGASLLKTINKGVLDVVSGTLKQFTLIASSKYSSEISIDGFTGSEPLIALEYVKFNYNLNNSITQNSFTGLINVKTLDLSECQIVTIGAGAFDAISNSVLELNLENNLIKTLPDGLFTYVLHNQVASIFINGNKWECECPLIPFKECLLANPNSFVGTAICNEPAAHKSYNVVERSFCESYVTSPSTPTTTSQTTQTTTTITTSTSTADNNSSPAFEATTEASSDEPEEFSQNCYELEGSELPKIVSIKTPKASLAVHENYYGNVVVDVDTLSENFVLLWFSLNNQETHYTVPDELTCVIGATRSLPIDNLKEDTPYTICMMDSNEKTISPLDCISYTRKLSSEQPWLFDNNKGLVISMAIVLCSISFFAGLVMGLSVLRIIKTRRIENGNRKINGCINEVLKETFQSNSIM